MIETPEEQLKKLIIPDELVLLKRLRLDTDELEGRVGNDNAFSRTGARLLPRMLRTAGEEHGERVAAALSPLVIHSIRQEIRNSRDQMIDALYPLTGQLVVAAVRNGLQELLASINATLEATFSPRRWWISIRALLSGRSRAEVLLRDAPPFDIDEALAIHRPTGLLVARARGEVSPGMAMDEDLVGGLLTGIMAFARDSFGHKETGELRTLSFGKWDLFIQASPAVLLVVKAKGCPPQHFVSHLEEAFFAILERWGSVLRDFEGSLPEEVHAALVVDLRDRLDRLRRDVLDIADANLAKRQRRGRKLLAGFIAALIVLGVWLGATNMTTVRHAAIEAEARAVVAAQPGLASYPIAIAFDPEARTLELTGMVPRASLKDRLLAELSERLPAIEVRSALAALDADVGEPLALRMRAGEQRLAEEVRDLGAEVEALVRRIEAVKNSAPRALASDIHLLRQTASELKSRVDNLESGEAPPITRLQAWLRRNAIFFSEGTLLRGPDQADSKLRELATLLEAIPQRYGLRAVGYADPSGSPDYNDRLSLSRATVVIRRLEEFGVPATRLLSVGRSYEKLLTPEVGPQSASRRVEFELILLNQEEAADRP